MTDAANNKLFSHDEFSKPLGVGKPTRASVSLRLPFKKVALGLVGVSVLSLSGYILLVDDPLGGQPYAISPIEKAAPEPRAVEPERTSIPDAPVAQKNERTAAELEAQAGVSVVRPEGEAPVSVVIRVPDPASIKLNPAPDPRLHERTRYGLLPKIGPDGARAAEVYARPEGILSSGARPLGRIAIVVGGLGIGQSVSADAIAKLPPAITLAFAPYGSNLDRLVAKARDEGHEVMLQVPMEPFDYPDNDPGPHTLTVQAKPSDNLDRLHWVMGRFEGYTGLVNVMGAKLTAHESALAPLLKEIGQRGLLFLDDGSSQRSQVLNVARQMKTGAARADSVIDAVPRADAIDQELARLEAMARDKGFAVGTASALPVSVERIAQWAAGLEGKGLLLTPVSTKILADQKR